jgi:translation initiation factor eIF-2B subunit alpha
LSRENIPVTVIIDAAAGYSMGKADLVLFGAEGVVENGGIINKVQPAQPHDAVASRGPQLTSSAQVGTYQMAVLAKACNKPVYAVVEQFKFLRLFPLSQYDLPKSCVDENPFPLCGTTASLDSCKVTTLLPPICSHPPGNSHPPRQFLNPRVDYTPPSLISLLFTDIGVMPPSAVSDELIKLYA